MIKGLGNDIIEVNRIESIITKYGSHFLNRIFSKNEQKYCLKYRDSGRHFAGRFAAKEAIVKALGKGFRDGVSWLDIEIINDEKGKPSVLFSRKLNEQYPGSSVWISISHCRKYATAVAIWTDYSLS